jgi:DNA-nicking Smr family endonuclease
VSSRSRGLDALQGVKAALAKAREEEEARAKAERERLAQEARERTLFTSTVGRVTPLPPMKRATYRQDGIGLDVVRKLRRGGWVIQAEVDLHGLRTEEAREHLAQFVRDAVARRMRCVRVVHGKGLGSPGREPVLKAKVRGWLVQKTVVLAFVQARAAEGGSGALIVLLKAPAANRSA